MRTLDMIYSQGPCPVCKGPTDELESEHNGVNIYYCVSGTCNWWYVVGLDLRHLGPRADWMGPEVFVDLNEDYQ